MSTNTEVNYPLVYAKPPVVKLAICYNPFIPDDLAKYLLVYNQYNTLADYMVGLPESVEWAVAYNGLKIEPENWLSIKPQPDSIITIVRVPEGGKDGGAKDVLRIIAMIAMAAVVAFTAPYLIPFLTGMGMSAAIATAVATTALTMAGAMIVNALLPSQQTNLDQGPTSQSYGIDGPKNTSKEGVPLPVVYGEQRVAGNTVDLFTRNYGDDQYLYLRTVLNDGAVADVRDILVNNQDIANFADVEYRINFGTAGEETVSWFDHAISLNNIQQKITTTGVLYTTTDAVDRLRVDVAFPAGLIHISEKSGNKYDGNCDLQIEYREMSTNGLTPVGSWADLPLELEVPVDTTGSTGIYSVGLTKSATFSVTPDEPADSGNLWLMTAEYKRTTDTVWQTLDTKIGNLINAVIYQHGYTQSKELPNISWTLNFPSTDTWQVRFVGGSLTSGSEHFSNLSGVPASTTNLHVQRQTQSPFRLTYQSSTLPHKRYQVRVKRALAELDDEANDPSGCYVIDVGEVQNENVNYEGIAMLSMKIKLNDQLSAAPNVTALVKGSLLAIYDDEGNVSSTEWSDNPADIVMDMLLNPDRGGGYSPNKVVWSQISEFRDHCEAEGLKFNGVFDFVTTLWDGMQSVARCGHGVLVPQGTRYTIAIDRAATPTMVFTGSNMYMDSFQKTWVNLNDRANEIQQSYYDADDGYRQKTIRLPDAEAQSRGDKPKPASVSGFGITNPTQATSEAEYQARHNAYTTNFVSFDAPIEAIGLSIGDVCLIQHDSVKYAEGVGGRLEAASTTTVINLDRPVTMTTGHTYSLLISTDAVQLYSPTITAVTSTKVTVSGLPTSNLPRIRRLKQGVHDREVLKILSLGGGIYSLTLDDTTDLTTGGATLWDTDVIIERQVQYVAGDSMSVTLTAPLPGAPKQYSNFLFGQVATVKMPYRLTAISADDDLYKRTLSFTNYDARIYAPGSWGVPTLSSSVVQTVSQVLTLHATWDSHPAVDQQRLKVTLDWQRPTDTSYGGADIYLQQNSGAWFNVGTSTNATTWQGDFNRGDVLVFRVVAFNSKGERALADMAPTVGVTLDTYEMDVTAPSSLSQSLTAFDVTGTVHAAWIAPTVKPDAYEVAVRLLSDADYLAFVNAGSVVASYPASVTGNDGYIIFNSTPDTKIDITSLVVGKYALRVRSVQGYAISEWAYLPMQVAAPTIPTVVTNVRLSNAIPSEPLQFASSDAHFAWDDVLTQQGDASGLAGDNLVNFFLDYAVKIYDVSDNLLRTEYTTSPTYSYTLAKNQSDTHTTGITAHRSFKLSVSLRGKQGQVSTATVITVSNPAPALTSAHIVLGASQTTLAYIQPTDTDFAGVRVWLSTTSGFTPGAGNVVYQGTGNATFTTVDDTVYYYRYAFYDAFGLESLNMSGESSFTAGVGVATGDADHLGGIPAEDIIADLVANSENILKENLLNDTKWSIQQALNYTAGGDSTQFVSVQAKEKSETAYNTVSLLGALSTDGLAFVLNSSIVMNDGTTNLASELNSLRSTLDASTVTITDLREVVDGVSGRVSIAVNGTRGITGLDFGVDGNSDHFDIVSSNFRLIDPSDHTNVRTPISYSGGILKMENVEVDSIKAGSITSEAFGVNQLVKRASTVLGGSTGIGVVGQTNYFSIPAGSWVQIIGHALIQPPSAGGGGNYTMVVRLSDTTGDIYSYQPTFSIGTASTNGTYTLPWVCDFNMPVASGAARVEVVFIPNGTDRTAHVLGGNVVLIAHPQTS